MTFILQPIVIERLGILFAEIFQTKHRDRHNLMALLLKILLQYTKCRLARIWWAAQTIRFLSIHLLNMTI